MNNKSKIVIIISIIGLALVLVTVTYAYFSARITGIESASTISMTAGTMSIHYSEGDDTLTANNIYPRAEEWISKDFTLTGNNTTDQLMEYEVGIEIITNTFKGGQLSYSLIVDENNDGTSMAPVTNKAIVGQNRTQKIGEGSFGTITDGVQNYTLKIYFLDNGKNQNINQGAVFNAKLTIGEKKSVIASIDCIDEAHPNPANGNAYVNGQYKYIYSSYDNGWSVVINDPTSTDPVTTKLCSSVNNKPIVSMENMFTNSQATSIDLSSFDTSNVTNMEYMFHNAKVTTLDFSSFDTSNVKKMYSMFRGCSSLNLDLSSFDTSNVINMVYMFSGSAATTLDLSSFNTSKIDDMHNMFEYSQAASLDLSSFDTSNVTDMNSMFQESKATSFDLSSFDTSNVTDMGGMFGKIVAPTLDLSSFDTSNVTYNYAMFQNATTTTGYARTQADADALNSSGNKPAGLTFVVKP